MKCAECSVLKPGQVVVEQILGQRRLPARIIDADRRGIMYRGGLHPLGPEQRRPHRRARPHPRSFPAAPGERVRASLMLSNP